MKWLALVAFATACGSSSAPPQPKAPQGPSDADRAAEAERQERARRDELAAAHRTRLDEQATALAATCSKPALAAEQHCTPSCYTPEPPDARATKRPLRGASKIDRLVCTTDPEAGPFVILDDVGGTLAVRPARGRFPKPAKGKSWRVDVEAKIALALKPELERGDVAVVVGDWQPRTHPVTKQSWRCASVAQYTRARSLDVCGSRGKTTCEANGSFAAYGLNLLHFRVAEAERLQAANDLEGCKTASLEALAIARGMPRWRQYVTLNVDQWKAYPRYRTRFDGILDEEGLFARVAELGTRAESVHTACGGAPQPKTTAAHEQSFHACDQAARSTSR